MDDIADVHGAVFNPAGDVALISVVPDSSPTSRATKDLIAEIRDRGTELHADTNADVMVTGVTAVDIDVSTKLADAAIPYLAVAVAVGLALLLLLYRSIAIPLKAALSFMLSIAATLGFLVCVFQWGWFGLDRTSPLNGLLPILLISVLFGLSMNHELLLVTRMREEYTRGARPTQAIVADFRHSARIVTASAVIMIAVFAGFFLVLDDMDLIKQIGLGLATAVFFDRRVLRRLRGPHDHRSGRDDPARPPRLGPAQVAGPRPARRGRARREAPPGTGHRAGRHRAAAPRTGGRGGPGGRRTGAHCEHG
jgi:RND superfamily putative drug exporter